LWEESYSLLIPQFWFEVLLTFKSGFLLIFVHLNHALEYVFSCMQKGRNNLYPTLSFQTPTIASTITIEERGWTTILKESWIIVRGKFVQCWSHHSGFKFKVSPIFKPGFCLSFCRSQSCSEICFFLCAERKKWLHSTLSSLDLYNGRVSSQQIKELDNNTVNDMWYVDPTNQSWSHTHVLFWVQNCK
jgi:hypothetical protein